MKRLLSFFLMVCIIFSLFGCASEEPEIIENEAVFGEISSESSSFEEEYSETEKAEKTEGGFRLFTTEGTYFCDKLIVACPTYDGCLFPCMEDFLYHLKIKTYRNRKVGIVENGSWAPMSGKLMRAYFEQMKDITICENIKTAFCNLVKRFNFIHLYQSFLFIVFAEKYPYGSTFLP